MNPLAVTRRELLTKAGAGVGMAALAGLFSDETRAEAIARHFAPKARRIIYLTQSGAPSQVDLFDYKPLLEKFKGQELPDSVRMGQRLDRKSTRLNSSHGYISYAGFCL